MANRQSDWINKKTDKLYDLILDELFEEEDTVTTKDLFIVLGAFIRAYGASMTDLTVEVLDEQIENAFDAIDNRTSSTEEVIYLIGVKLLNIGLMMDDANKEEEMQQEDFATLKDADGNEIDVPEGDIYEDIQNPQEIKR